MENGNKSVKITAVKKLSCRNSLSEVRYIRLLDKNSLNCICNDTGMYVRSGDLTNLKPLSNISCFVSYVRREYSTKLKHL